VLLVGVGGCARGELCRKWVGMAGTGADESARDIRLDRRRSTVRSAMSRWPTVLERGRGVKEAEAGGEASWYVARVELLLSLVFSTRGKRVLIVP
jgi:hypothetical protein